MDSPSAPITIEVHLAASAGGAHRSPFDNANELTSISFDKGTTHIGDLAYTYDAGGRRITMTGSLAAYVPPSFVPTLAYDGTNRLTSWNGAAIGYDANGSMTSFGSTTYTWNDRNQMTATSAGSASFSYDALGRRTAATISGANTAYLYDGLNPVTMGSNFMLAGAGLDEIYARINASGTTSFLRDGLNNTLALSNSSDATTVQYAYSPYGDTAKTGTDSTPLDYTGREDDAATGLYYYRARYYSPQLGRFIGEDPIGLGGGTNFYAYVRGNPISLIDPLGLCPDRFHCLWVAAQAKGISIGLDILGAIPGVGNATSAATWIARAGIAAKHVVTSPAASIASGVYGAYGAVTAGPVDPTDTIVGGVSASAGIAATLADLSVGGTNALPIVGNGFSALTGLWDAYKTIQIYQECMAGN